LKELGKQLLDSESDLDLDQIDRLLTAVVVRDHVDRCASDDDLELIEWGAGSIRGQFRKSIKGLREKLRKALQGLNNLLPSVDPAEFKAALAETLSTGLSETGKQVAAGVGAVGAVSARRSLYEGRRYGGTGRPRRGMIHLSITYFESTSYCPEL